MSMNSPRRILSVSFAGIGGRPSPRKDALGVDSVLGGVASLSGAMSLSMFAIVRADSFRTELPSFCQA